jgi:hypothetical protein
MDRLIPILTLLCSHWTVSLRSEHKEFRNFISCTKIKAKYTFKDKARAENMISDCVKRRDELGKMRRSPIVIYRDTVGKD